MDTVTSVLQSIGDGLSSFFETITTAVGMLGMSFRFIEFFIRFLPSVIASGVAVFLGVFLLRFFISK